MKMNKERSKADIQKGVLYEMVTYEMVEVNRKTNIDKILKD
jgi:hypothetical protein